MDKAVSISVKNISVYHDQKRVLHNISLNLKSGACLGIIGPNGSGKSTLLQALLGFLPLSSGSIQLCGQDTHAMTARERARLLAYVGQDLMEVQTFNVESLLDFAYFPWQESMDFNEWRKERERLCQLFKLSDKLKRSLSSLSGGERQRVSLVQSLLQRPQLLLLDEITNHLDITYQLETLRYLKAAPFTKVMVLHDLNLAARYCDQLLLLKDGLCLGFGSPSEILTQEKIWELFGVFCEIVLAHGRIRFVEFGELDSQF